MADILKTWKKDGVIITGSDNLELDTPIFGIIDVKIDTVAQVLHVEILHKVQQGTLERLYSRSFDVPFAGLPTAVKQTGKSFLDAIEAEILLLPQYVGSTEV